MIYFHIHRKQLFSMENNTGHSCKYIVACIKNFNQTDKFKL